jgi:hypothetical protein
MRTILHASLVVTLTLAAALPLRAQTAGDPNEIPEAGNWVALSGPRFGATVITGEAADRLQEEYGLNPVLLQFGWQMERRFFDSDAGIGGVTELIVLVGGLEQGTAIPSASFVVGLRNRDGFELGVGPNASPAGLGLALGGGINVRAGAISFPINVAIVSSETGVRFSTLVGFTTRR